MHLKIGSHSGWYPDSAACSLEGFNRRKGCERPGFGPEVLDFLLRYMNITYEIVKLSPTLNSGQIVDERNNTWDGVLGNIQAGKYDTIAAPYVISDIRYKTFDFTSPITGMEPVFVVGPPVPDILNLSFRIFAIFDPLLSAAVLATIILLLFGLFATHVISKHECIPKAADFNNSEQKSFNTALQNASKQRMTAGKFLILLFGAALVFFVGLYEGCLLTYLLLPRKPLRMTESQLLDDVKEKRLTFVIDENQYYMYGHWQTIRLSTDEKFKKYQLALRNNPPFFINLTVTSPVEFIENNPGKYVYMGDNGFTALVGNATCRLHFIEMDNPESFKAGFVVRKNSNLTGLFNAAIHSNLAFIQTINDRYYNFKSKKDECKKMEKVYEVPPLGLLTMLGSFCLLAIGSISSSIYFLIELFCTRKKRDEYISLLSNWSFQTKSEDV